MKKLIFILIVFSSCSTGMRTQVTFVKANGRVVQKYMPLSKCQKKKVRLNRSRHNRNYGIK
jgi:hypothetical protein